MLRGCAEPKPVRRSRWEGACAIDGGVMVALVADEEELVARNLPEKFLEQCALERAIDDDGDGESLCSTSEEVDRRTEGRRARSPCSRSTGLGSY